MTGNQYVSFPLSALHASCSLPGDLYLFVGGRFVKLYHCGDEITPEKYDSFVMRKVQFLFIDGKQLDQFKNWSEQFRTQKIEKHVGDMGEGARPVAELTTQIREDFLDFVTSPSEEQNIKSILDQTKKLAQTILARRVVADLLSKMQLLGGTFVDHGTNVGNISIFIGASLGYTHQIVLENLFLGGLLHDYGKIKIDSALRDNPESEEYRRALQDHPSIGRAALMTETKLGDEVLDIVAQHHERHDGLGKPMGLKGSRIYELTKIVSIANRFDHHVQSVEGTLKFRQLEALRLIEAEAGKEFDPKIVQKVLRCMRIIIGPE